MPEKFDLICNYSLEKLGVAFCVTSCLLILTKKFLTQLLNENSQGILIQAGKVTFSGNAMQVLLCEGANAFGNLPIFLLQVTVAFGKVSFKQFVVLCRPPFRSEMHIQLLGFSVSLLSHKSCQLFQLRYMGMKQRKKTALNGSTNDVVEGGFF